MAGNPGAQDTTACSTQSMYHSVLVATEAERAIGKEAIICARELYSGKMGGDQASAGFSCSTRLCYCHLLQAAHIIQAYWRWCNCQAHGFFRGRYDLTASHLGLELDIFLGSHICRITDCIPFPIKNWSGRLQHSVTRPLSDKLQFSSVAQSLWPYGLQHTRPPCPSVTPGIYSNSYPLSHWCHPAISSSVIPFSSCLQSFPASGSFQMSQPFASGGQSIGVSASASVLPMNSQDWFPLGRIGWISLQSKGLSRVFSNTTVQKHQFFGAQLSLWSNSHIHTRLLAKP